MSRRNSAVVAAGFARAGSLAAVPVWAGSAAVECVSAELILAPHVSAPAPLVVHEWAALVSWVRPLEVATALIEGLPSMVVQGSPATPASIMMGWPRRLLRVSALWFGSGHWRSRVSLGVSVLRRFPN